jgi:hypothetical protein
MMITLGRFGCGSDLEFVLRLTPERVKASVNGILGPAIFA